jgi:hypothetical protein
MPRFFTALLVILAVAAALAVSMHAGLRLITVASIGPLTVDSVDMVSNLSSTFPQVSLAESCYPFNQQAAERAQLEKLLEPPAAPPEETDALGLARYAEYARRLDWQDADYEQVMREGMRRDPNNALYHYLLAFRRSKLALEGDYREKGMPDGSFDYRVKDRPLLDQAMEELATGLQLPLNNRRYDLIIARLNAMPKARLFEERFREMAMLYSTDDGGFTQMRQLGRISSFYLSLLLSERRRTKAESFLRTSERMNIQLAGEKVLTLNGLEYGFTINTNSMRDDSAVCRQHGLTDETEEIARRYAMVTGAMQRWRDSQRNEQQRDRFDMMLKQRSSLWDLLPLASTFDPQSITPETLRPSRLIEYTVYEEIAVVLLPLLFVGLMLYSALKYLRWRLALAGQEVPPHDMRLSAGDWLRVLLIGFLLPVGLYALYIALPISGRGYNLYTSSAQFLTGVGVFLLWVLIIPTSIAAGAVWGRSMDAGIIEEHRPGAAALFRGFSSVLALIWAVFAARSLLLLPGLLALDLFTVSRFHASEAPLGSPWLEHAGIVLLLVLLAFLPALWERYHTDCSQHFLALSRAMIPVYAVLALCTAALYPALLNLERHYLRQDKVMTTMRTTDTIAFTQAEGRLVLELREMVLKGARQLEAVNEINAEMGWTAEPDADDPD